MKKIFTAPFTALVAAPIATLAMLFVLVLPTQAMAQSNLWQEGKHYEVISDTASEKAEVIEYFSFWCPACYNAEPLVKQIKAQLPEGVAFKKVHVNFMGMAGPQAQNDATKAMVIAKALKQEDELNAAIFDYIHRQRSVINNLNDLRSIFVVNGVDGEQFDKLAKSFSVRSLVKRNNDSLAKHRSDVTGVPTFIVNGKYKATFTRDMNVQQIVDLIVWLSKQS